VDTVRDICLTESCSQPTSACRRISAAFRVRKSVDACFDFVRERLLLSFVQFVQCSNGQGLGPTPF